MRNQCGCGVDNTSKNTKGKKDLKPVVQTEEPLVFETPESKKMKAYSLKSKRAIEPVQEEKGDYEKTTLINDAELKPRENIASGWLWFGAALMAGGIIYKTV